MAEEQPSVSISLSKEEIAILGAKAKSHGLTVEEFIHEILSKYCSY